MSDPRVSIILPTLNGEHHLARLLPMIARQRFEGGFEIRAIDSDSSDRTRELLVFLSQDALPRDESFLAELVRAFDDPRVAGAYARILPHEADDPLTKRTALDAPEASDVAETRDLDRVGSLATLSPNERARFVVFNNVASAIRRSVFEKIPFPDVAFGEDSAWAARALEAGHRIRFTPESVVLHAHRYDMRTAYERYRIDAAFQLEEHGNVIRPSLWSVARGIAHEVRRDARFAMRHGGALHLLRSPFLRSAQVFGQRAGSGATRRG